MTQEILQFIEATEKVSLQLQLLVDCEQEKRQALLRQEAEKIESLVQAQQAMVMKLDSLEKKRITAQRDAGLADKNVNQILESVDSQTQMALRPSLEKLSDVALHLQNLNRASMEIASTELKLMDQASRSYKEDVQGLYTSGGKSGTFSNSGTGFQEKI